MTTYNTGYPYSNMVAVPPVMEKPVELSGRVRIAYGKVTCSAVQEASGSIINITKLPLGARVLGLLTKFGDMSDGSATLTLKAGTTAISAAKAVGSAQAAYAWDYTGVGVDVSTEAMRVISGTVGTAALNGTAGVLFECQILYAID